MNSDSSFNNNDAVREETGGNRPARSFWTPAIGIGLVAVAAFSCFQYSQLNSLRQELNDNRKQTAVDIQSQIASLNSALSGTASDLQEKLADTQQQTSQTIAKAQDAAKRHAETVADNVQKTIEQKDAERQAAVDAELAGVKNSASDTASQISSRIDGVGATVDSVKTDLASTKAVADKTASDLQRATGDMGVMSGLIATNGKQIDELRALGDRNIYEFNISKKAGLQKVGDVQIKVTKTDDKKNRYTIAVMADDKLVEKKDKTTNEPVQFYATPGTRTPDEIVVNEVGKDTIKGYLATPKITTARK